MKASVKNYSVFADKLINVLHLLSSDKTSDHTKAIKEINALKKKALKLSDQQEIDGDIVPLVKESKPKVLNSYMKWANVEGPKLRAENPHLRMTEISKLLGKIWRENKGDVPAKKASPVPRKKKGSE